MKFRTSSKSDKCWGLRGLIALACRSKLKLSFSLLAEYEIVFIKKYTCHMSWNINEYSFLQGPNKVILDIVQRFHTNVDSLIIFQFMHFEWNSGPRISHSGKDSFTTENQDHLSIVHLRNLLRHHLQGAQLLVVLPATLLRLGRVHGLQRGVTLSLRYAPANLNFWIKLITLCYPSEFS